MKFTQTLFNAIAAALGLLSNAVAETASQVVEHDQRLHDLIALNKVQVDALIKMEARLRWSERAIQALQRGEEMPAPLEEPTDTLH